MPRHNHSQRMRISHIALLLVLSGMIGDGQTTANPELQANLQRLFPTATAFSSKTGDPPHFKAFGPGTAGAESLLGFVFWTTELEPLERGYDGPIKVLVGMDPRGRLTNIVVVEHYEPYGDFSIEPPAFPKQFENKSIRDRFKVGMDIDAIARATITVTSTARAVRNSARQIARANLTPEDVK